VARAESLGVWRAELHGLTHFDLAWLRRSVESGDPLALRARALGIHAARGIGRQGELGHAEPARAHAVLAAAVEGFRQRFGRDPVSLIAPDYRWCDLDERIAHQLGLRVVQAKSEQIDPTLRPASALGRLRKRLRSVVQRRRGDLLYLDRCAQLEPYGDADRRADQGADRALGAIRDAWAAGEPAVLAMHRLQWVHLDPTLPLAMQAQFTTLMAALSEAGGARFLVDAEIEQLERRGWSALARGDRWVLRNFTANAVRISLPDLAAPLTLRPGTLQLRRGFGDPPNVDPAGSR
jgi:hypothetical protein